MLRNFLKQYVDGESMELKRLSANQFMEIWENYDKDGINTLSKYLKNPSPLSSNQLYAIDSIRYPVGLDALRHCTLFYL
jgi:hypothetical protein